MRDMLSYLSRSFLLLFMLIVFFLCSWLRLINFLSQVSIVTNSNHPERNWHFVKFVNFQRRFSLSYCRPGSLVSPPSLCRQSGLLWGRRFLIVFSLRKSASKSLIVNCITITRSVATWFFAASFRNVELLTPSRCNCNLYCFRYSLLRCKFLQIICCTLERQSA